MRILVRTLISVRTLSLAVSVVGFSLALLPAYAQQDGLSQQFDDIRNAVGLGKERPPMDFTERPPIVVPPTYNLPQPGTGDPEHLDVNDPDVASRRKALTDPRRPVPPTDPGAAATGRDARTYLIDPPSGMRDPARVAADIEHDTSSPAGVHAKHVHVHKKKIKDAAQ